MSVNIFNIFLHVIAIIMNGIKYCPTQISHTQALDSSDRELRIMVDQHFIPYYALCQQWFLPNGRPDVVSTLCSY
jgi:hypothetical protein